MQVLLHARILPQPRVAELVVIRRVHDCRRREDRVVALRPLLEVDILDLGQVVERLELIRLDVHLSEGGLGLGLGLGLRARVRVKG